MITVQAKGNKRAEIRVYGRIGEGFFSEGVTAKSVREQLDEAGDVTDIDVLVNSPGGNVWDGLAIANILATHPAEVHAQVDGLAASAASIITSAADFVTMGKGAMMMVHSPWALFTGNAEDLRKMADTLDKVESGMLDIYEGRTEMARDELLALLRAETWMTAQEAVEMGFADDVVVDKARDPESSQAEWAGCEPVMACFRKAPKDFHPLQATAGIQLSATAGAQPHKEEGMSNKAPASGQQPDTAAVAAAEEAARTAERARVTEITSLCDKFGMDAAFANKAIADGLTKDQVNAQILDAKFKQTQGGTPGHADLTEDEHDKMRAAAADWLIARSGVGKHDPANPFRGMTIENIAREVLEMSGVRTRGMGREAVIKAAITHSTGDFPNIFENALHKTMLSAFEKAAPTWPRICRTSSLSDFRPHIRYRAGSFSDLLTVLENGEYQDGTIGDAERETITAVRKGRILNLSREMLINDDMSVFSNVAMFMGQAAARTLDKDVFALFALNSGNGPTMGDSNPLFHADHGNISATGGAPSMALFEEARVTMASQSDPSGNDYLDLRPDRWLGPLGLGGTARSINESLYDPDATNKLQKPNIVRGLYADIVDTPRLSGTPWYSLADPAVEPVFEVGFLDGVQVPQLVMEEAFRTDGIAWRVRYEYGVAAVGWRGIVKNAGQ